jgi:hypothetical protein
VITLSCNITIAGDVRPSSEHGEYRRIGESMLLSMLLDSVLLVTGAGDDSERPVKGVKGDRQARGQLCFGCHLAADLRQVILTWFLDAASLRIFSMSV